MNQPSDLSALIAQPLSDDAPAGVALLHRHYVAFIHEVVALAGGDLDPAVVDEQVTADMLGVSEEHLRLFTDAQTKGALLAITANIQGPVEAMTQALRAALQIGYRVAQEQAAGAKVPAP
jgi:hypothetical protein